MNAIFGLHNIISPGCCKEPGSEVMELLTDCLVKTARNDPSALRGGEDAGINPIRGFLPRDRYHH